MFKEVKCPLKYFKRISGAHSSERLEKEIDSAVCFMRDFLGRQNPNFKAKINQKMTTGCPNCPEKPLIDFGEVQTRAESPKSKSTIPHLIPNQPKNETKKAKKLNFQNYSPPSFTIDSRNKLGSSPDTAPRLSSMTSSFEFSSPSFHKLENSLKEKEAAVGILGFQLDQTSSREDSTPRITSESPVRLVSSPKLLLTQQHSGYNLPFVSIDDFDHLKQKDPLTSHKDSGPLFSFGRDYHSLKNLYSASFSFENSSSLPFDEELKRVDKQQ